MAARGLDIPRVDWIVQFDPPDDPRDYIHRVGRTARAGKVGKSLLFLLKSELGFLRYLKEAKVPLNEFSFPADKIANVQSQVCTPLDRVSEYVLTCIILIELEKLLQKNYFLHKSAKDGFRAYLQAYASYSLKKIFDVNQLDLAKVGKAFGFAVPPRVNLNLGPGRGTSSAINKKRRREEGSDEEEFEELQPEMDGQEEEVSRKDIRRDNKHRRIEALGQKKVEKEKYKKDKERRKLEAGGGQWSR